MTGLRNQNGLLYVSVSLTYQGQILLLTNAVVDTGAARTIVSAGSVEEVGMEATGDDPVRQVRGVGGSELVYAKTVERFAIDMIALNDFEIEVGIMDYGIEIDALIGLDFLMGINAVINLKEMTILSDRNTSEEI